MNFIRLENVNLSKLPSIDIHPKPFLFEGKYFKLIHPNLKDEFIKMFKSGLIDQLINQNLVPDTKISNYKVENYENYLVLEQEMVDIMYPLEFSFSMIKDAAFSFLKLYEILDKNGYILKDCHAYNVGYRNGKFVYIDMGSFQPKNSNQFEFPCYEEFFVQYIIPLKLLSKGYPHFSNAILEYYYGGISSREILVDFFRLNIFFRLIPRDTLKKIIKYYFGLRTRNIDSILEKLENSVTYRKNKALLSLLKKISKNHIINNFLGYKINSIRKLIEKIENPTFSTTWGNYYESDFDKNGRDENSKLSTRLEKMINLVSSLDIESIVDIGSNMGLFIFNLLKKTNKIKKAFCLDTDVIAIEKLYLINKNYFKFPVIPIVNNPFIPRLKYFEIPLFERCKSDIVTALAITHHLILRQNLSIDYILQTLNQFSKKYLLIEFMPLGLWDGKKTPLLPDWYNRAWFESNLEKNFRILESDQTEQNRVYYLCIKKDF